MDKPWGIRPLEEVNWAIWPTAIRPFLTFPAHVWNGWLASMVSCMFWPLDWPSGHLAGTHVCVYGGSLGRNCTWSRFNKSYWEIWGTWESNPGPNTCMPTHLPMELVRFFVSLVDNDYYERENNIMLEE